MLEVCFLYKDPVCMNNLLSRDLISAQNDWPKAHPALWHAEDELGPRHCLGHC